jgi:diguanylate cyclase (GGDEF)-like protein
MRVDRTGHQAVPAGDAPADVLYESERTRVLRVPLADGTGSAIYKELLGRGSVARVRHETAVLERLAGVVGVPRLLATPTPTVMLLEDTDARSLAAVAAHTPLSTTQLLELARRLGSIVAEVHGRGVVHRDINPANVVLNGPQQRPMLIDFDLATTVAEERPALTQQGKMMGTLPYLPPEQTGRTGLGIDFRADLYCLGATLFELVCGRRLFDGDDQLQLIQDILVRVPTPLVELDSSVPPGLSAIVSRLLEKEPGRRYQSAEGLVHDLTVLAEQPFEEFRLGERDFPARLVPPSHVIGRDSEISALRTACEATGHASNRGLLVTGAPGIGKSALVSEARPMVGAQGGWFAAGKADQYGNDPAGGALFQAMRAVGRLLLAEPEADLAVQRHRINAALGSNAALITAVMPEFATLLEPASTDGVQADGGNRLQQATVALLRAIASPTRPLVLVVDDLQWADPATLGLVDAVLTDTDLRNVLLIGTYRSEEVDAAHPLTAMLLRWERLGVAPAVIHLSSLPSTELSALLGEMLRMPADVADDLAGAIADRTGGNPFDTIELVNALRQDGVLTLGATGWSFDRTSIRQYVGRGNVSDLLRDRIGRLARPARELLEITACLGGVVQLDLLAAAADRPVADVHGRLMPAVEDGLLAVDRAESHHRGEGVVTVRFRQDRMHQAVHDGFSPAARADLQLSLARRLAPLPDYGLEAAVQYLAAIELVTAPGERELVIGLLRAAAAAARPAGNHQAVERYLSSALALCGDATPQLVLVAVEIELHAALYSLGLLAEADTVYGSLESRCTDPLDLIEASYLQISSLTNRGRTNDAVRLGMSMLGQLGFPTPGADIAAEVQQRFNAVRAWAGAASVASDLDRPEVTDPSALTAAMLLSRMCPAAYFGEPTTVLAWIVTEGQRLWSQYGPIGPLVAVLAHASFSTIGVFEDYHTGYRIVRHAVAVGEARGYEPATSQARFLFAVSASYWSEPLEESVRQARAAREALMHGGDLQMASFTYYPSIIGLFEFGAVLDIVEAEADAALALGARVGNGQATGGQVVFRQLVRALRGETETPGGFTDSSFDEATYLATCLENDPVSAVYLRIQRALSAALFGDITALVEHTTAVMPMLIYMSSIYSAALAHLLRAVALAEQLRDNSRETAPDERAAMLVDLDDSRNWLSRRAVDVPANFGHLLLLVDAERAWAEGDFRSAVVTFDAAVRKAEASQRPWHRAFIAERAGLFQLSSGMDRAGRDSLAEARSCYEAWGATAKLQQLDERYPYLRSIHRAPTGSRSIGGTLRSAIVSADTIDMLAILRASQALSSATNLDRLHTAVVAQLRTLTGAVGIEVALYDEDARNWFLPFITTQNEGGSGGTTLGEAGARGLVPATVVKYVERTREPLLVENACGDDRFARDPYFAGTAACSLLVVPISSQGTMRAVLVLTNHLSNSAFTTDRLDTVMLLASQLAVSLDNALLYRSLEERVAERTQELAAANRQLEVLSGTDALTKLANRRRFTEVTDQEWARAVRTGRPLGIAMIDVDHFKKYNDHYGHLGGDECLRQVAAAVNSSVREGTDLPCRYGGEEFAIILPEVDAATAHQIGERVRTSVSALEQPHVGSSLGIVTISVGVATMVPTASQSVEALIEAADAALYEAKEDGRNQVRYAILNRDSSSA